MVKQAHSNEINRIIFISKGNIPARSGNGMQVMKMSQALARLVDHFELITVGDMRSMFRKDQSEIFDMYGISDPFKITRLPLFFYRPDPIPPEVFHSLYFNTSILYTMIKSPDLVYTRSNEVVDLLINNNRFIVQESHYPPKNIPGERIVQRNICKNYLGLITISQTIAEAYRKAGLSDEKILVIPDGVDIERYSTPTSSTLARHKLGLSSQSKIALYTGHMDIGWGVMTIIEAAIRLPDIQFFLIGGYEKHVTKLQRYCEELGLRNLKFLGFIPNSKIPTYQFAADVLLMPYSQKCFSREWMSPMKMFEYMATGKPIIATRLSPLLTVLNNSNSILIDPDNPVSLSDAIVEVINNQENYQHLGEKARKDVVKYSWDQRAKTILGFISKRIKVIRDISY